MAVRAAIYRKKSNPLKGKVIDYKDIKTLSVVFPKRTSVNWQPPSSARGIWG